MEYDEEYIRTYIVACAYFIAVIIKLPGVVKILFKYILFIVLIWQNEGDRNWKLKYSVMYYKNYFDLMQICIGTYELLRIFSDMGLK